MESRLAISFGKVANREREHPGEEAPGHLGISRKEASGQRSARAPGRRVARAFLGLLTVLSRQALGPSPIGALGPVRLAGGSEPGPMVPTILYFFIIIIILNMTTFFFLDFNTIKYALESRSVWIR